MTTAPRRSFAEMKVLADEFLASHRLGILATSKRDGTPQQSILGYAIKGTDIVISTGSDTAKVKNLRKRPGVIRSVINPGFDPTRVQILDSILDPILIRS